MPFEDIMHKFSKGKLFSSSGQKVTSKKQALAIGLSYKRRNRRRRARALS